MSKLFPQTTREYALQRVTRALLDELSQQDPEMLGTRAESLVAIAEHYDVPFETLLAWAHTRVPGKQWSGAEWRRFCEKYIEMKREQKASRANSEEVVDGL
jgi:hypothetical protein